MPLGAALASIATIVALASSLAPNSRAAVSHAPEPGVTRAAVTVAGIVPEDPSAAGADLGARARFARAGRVAGRAVHYLGTSSAKDAAGVARLTSEAFALVPVIGGDAVPAITQAGRPFVGLATSSAWRANRAGFGIAGSPVGVHGREPNPVWGRQLRALLGTARNQSVVIVTNDAASIPGRARRAPRPPRLQDFGFSVAAPIVAPDPASDADVATVANAIVTQNPAAVLALTSAPTVLALEQQLAARGYTGTVATEDALYAPDAPAPANGLTVLLTVGPLEADTAALRRMTEAVHAVDGEATITPAVEYGYFAADFFLRALARVGRDLTAQRFLRVVNRDAFTYDVRGTIGRSTWPAMHDRVVPCGALVQDDGSSYVVVEPYRCTPDVTTRSARP